MRTLFLVAAMAVAVTEAAPAAAEIAEPVEVMVLGTWHFANPGLDVVNVEAEDVRTPKRQRELESIAAALAEFAPTKIMVEKVASGPDLVDTGFGGFTPASLAERKDERVQIAYRLAHMLGHRAVYAVDEQPGTGEPDYFPFGKVVEHAQARGQMGKLQDSIAKVEADKKAFQGEARTDTSC